MKKTTQLDLILYNLSILNKSNKFITAEDLKAITKINDLDELKGGLEYLYKKGLIEKNENAYYINYEGQLFLEKNHFFKKGKPFSYENNLKRLKVFAVALNATLILLLGIVTFLDKTKIITINKEDVKKEKQSKIIDTTKLKK